MCNSLFIPNSLTSSSSSFSNVGERKGRIEEVREAVIERRRVVVKIL